MTRLGSKPLVRATYAAEKARAALPRPNTPGQAWRQKRNTVILIAAEAGCSGRFLADVFDLPRSRIAEILGEMRAAIDPPTAPE